MCEITHFGQKLQPVVKPFEMTAFCEWTVPTFPYVHVVRLKLPIGGLTLWCKEKAWRISCVRLNMY